MTHAEHHVIKDQEFIIKDIFSNEIKSKEVETYTATSSPVYNKYFLDSKRIIDYIECQFKYFKKTVYIKKFNYKKCSLCDVNKRTKNTTCTCPKLHSIFECDRNNYIYYENEYYRVLRIKFLSYGIQGDPVCVKSFLHKKVTTKNMASDNWVVCFDFETMPGSDQKLGAYALSYTLFSNNYFFENIRMDYETLYYDPFLRNNNVAYDFVDVLTNEKNPNFVFNIMNGITLNDDDWEDPVVKYQIDTLNMFGFNNFRFDDNFILNIFIDKG